MMSEDGIALSSLSHDKLMVHGRPVYVEDWHVDMYAIIFYSGSRWVHIDYAKQDFELFINKEWPVHAFWDGWYEILETPAVYKEVWVYVSDSTKKASPVGTRVLSEGRRR
jgi:hypothetical protein